ncbi:MAG: molybdenum cofactor guanylyltransferase [Erythrobacter sp.]|uniref:molybdenum cofactor guanylyltransferase n=1 Tax=Erythrobacter sp. TaxID=1042 RepID=UPI003266C101
MAAFPNIPICILAGGTSRRFGSDKALAMLGGKPLLEHVLDRVRQQTSGPIAINAPLSKGFERWELPIIPDTLSESIGPLAGILTAMEWASIQGFESIVTLAVDLPFAPLDLVSKLAEKGAPAIAITGDRWHPVNGLWRADSQSALRFFIDNRSRSAHGWAEFCGASRVAFDHEPGGIDPFWNVNTQDDLAAAERLAAQT